MEPSMRRARGPRGRIMKKIIAILTVVVVVFAASGTALANTYDIAANGTQVECPKGSMGGAKAGVALGAIITPFFLLGTIGLGLGGKRLRAHKKARAAGICQYREDGLAKR
jgi:hypothetical protein